MREITDLDPEHFLSIFTQIDFFAPFTTKERRAITGDCIHLVTYEVGEYLIQEGSSEERSLFILLSGGASVVKVGARIPLAAMMPGSFFGEVSFFTDRVRTTNVIVHPFHAMQTGSRVLTIPHLFALGLPAAVEEATASVLRFDPELMERLDTGLRIKIKDQIIQHLTRRVDRMHEQVSRLTGQDPMLTVDPELELQLRDVNAPMPERERTKDRLIEQLAEFLDELNNCLVAC